MRLPYRFALTTASLLGSVLWSAGAARAATLYFDAGGGTRNWDQSTTAAWSTTAGGPYSLSWNGGLGTDAVFEGTGGIVSIQATAPVSVSSLAFGTAGDKDATEKVKQSIAADAVLSQRQIKVNTLEGRVFLTGNVEAQREAGRAAVG